MNKKLVGILTLVAVVGVFILAKMFLAPPPPPKPAPAAGMNVSATLVPSYSPRTGTDMAKVQIVEFLDPECEACAAFFPVMKELLRRHPQDLQLVVRYMLFHGNSREAALATEAAGRQGKYFEMQEILFTRSEWTHQQSPQTEKFLGYARELGLDIEKFQSDMRDPAIAANVDRDFQEGPSFGVTGTPTIFVNGRMLEELSPAALQRLVQEELAK